MFKKSCVALAIAAMAAGTACAAEVSVYGLVDYSFNYQSREGDVAGYDSQSNFSMKSGANAGSRFGCKGEEDLGSFRVGFLLENGFDANTGSLNGGRMFNRESLLFLRGNFGEFSFGRVAEFASGYGSYALLTPTSTFSTGWGDLSGSKFTQAGRNLRWDNKITYVPPSFAGFKVYAQVSLGANSDDDHEKSKSSSDRYWALADVYNVENMNVTAIIRGIAYGKEETQLTNKGIDDAFSIFLGGNYDFGPLKVFAVGQYFDNELTVGYNERCPHQQQHDLQRRLRV